MQIPSKAYLSFSSVILFGAVVGLLFFPSISATEESSGQIPQEMASPEGVDGITRPSSDIELSFVQPGKIKEIMVEEGAMVVTGEPLIQQDDEIEQIQKRLLTARVHNLAPIEVARVELQQKRDDLAKLRKAMEKGATTQWEVDHAEVAVETALLTLKIREFDIEQDTLQLSQVVESIKRLTLTSPAVGIVEEVNIEEGETIQALSPVIRLVNIDPLYIDLPVPVQQAVALQKGDTGLVRFLNGDELQGEVINIATVADAAATTLDVRLMLPNPKRRPAGERVNVLFAR